MGRTSGLDLRSKRNGSRLVSQRAAGIGGSGGDEAAGGGSRPWTPRRWYEKAREMASGTAWAAGVRFGLRRGRNGQNRGEK
ncbi:hypothetical protein CDL15_Pgr018942 [Punica granatum]|uniref:Uncharacterized protein n=1 Tax=Punica granatum TaxID=22663 RepID=A0A218WPF6_PUNGR|nr:hypothetical protein CDL15_Pgr018942 [Punica granatum]PKI49981.1 hypothetical protein CRG98_029624 [Punica granatum]